MLWFYTGCLSIPVFSICLSCARRAVVVVSDNKGVACAPCGARKFQELNLVMLHGLPLASSNSNGRAFI